MHVKDAGSIPTSSRGINMCALVRDEAHMQLQVVVALADDEEGGLGGEVEGHRGHDDLLGVKGEAGVLALPLQLNQVVGGVGALPQEDRQGSLVHNAVFGAELDLHQGTGTLHGVKVMVRQGRLLCPSN